MKILFCIKSVATLGGGAERVFADVTDGLCKRNHDISILSFEPATTESFYSLNPQIRRYGQITKGLAPRGLLNLRRRIRKISPDIVVAFMPSSYVPLAFALAGSGIPLIASEHNVPARYRDTRLKWMVLNATSPFVFRYTAVSEQMRNQYPGAIRRKMDVIANPVALHAAGRADVIGSDERRTLLAVGRLHPQKDHLTLIRAFAAIANDCPEWVLRIAGDGTERDVLAEEIRRLGLSERAHLIGSLSDISAEYLNAQLYVISSVFESYGLATVEALAHGLPAIGFSDCPGTNELIRHGANGMLIDDVPSRTLALAAGLKSLMTNSQLRVELSNSPSPVTDKSHAIDDVLDAWQSLLHHAPHMPQRPLPSEIHSA